MGRWTTVAASILLAAASAAAAPLPQEAAPEAAKPRVLDRATAERLVVRAEENLHLHGLSMDTRYLRRALLDLRAAVAGLPEDIGPEFRFRAHFGLAFALARSELGRPAEGGPDPAAEALKGLQEAVKVHPDFPGHWILDGLLREQRDDYAEAITTLTRGLEGLDQLPDLPSRITFQLRIFAHLARARCYLNLSQAKEHLAMEDVQAAAALSDAAQFDPHTPPGNGLRRVVFSHLAATYQRLDQYENTLKVLGWLMEDDPGNADHRYNMALILAGQSKFPEAMAYYRQAAHLAPSDPRPHLKIAFVLLVFQTPGKEAEELALAARAGEVYLSLRRGVADAEYCAFRAELATKRKDWKEVERWARAALEKDPLCRTALSRLTQALGMRAEPGDAALEKELEELKKRMDESFRRERADPDRTFC